MYTPIKSGQINNMNHMRISEPSSVILEKMLNYLLKLNLKGWCNKPQKLQLHSFLTQNILMLSKRHEST